MTEDLMEPILLIDKSRDREAHLIASPNHPFEDILESAKRLNTKLFKGTWTLTYRNPDTKKQESVDPEDLLAGFLDRGIDTFYWDYKPSVFEDIIPKSMGRNRARDKGKKTSFNSRYRDKSKDIRKWRGQGVYAEENVTRGIIGSRFGILEYGDFVNRAVALFIDVCICSIISAILGGGIAGFLACLVYFAYFESSRYQATPGKMATKLRVSDVEGNRLSFGAAAVRFLAKLLSAMPFGIGFFLPLLTDRRQTLHDIIAKTLVLEHDLSDD